jgi:uncharacterized protein YuzB (UPF0349 family)
VSELFDILLRPNSSSGKIEWTKWLKGLAEMASSMNIKWCKKNLEHFSQAVYDMLKQEYPDIEMEVQDCVDLCGLCTDVPFALRNNGVVGARDPRGLYVKLKHGFEFMTKEPLPGTYAAITLQSNQEQVKSETRSSDT